MCLSLGSLPAEVRRGIPTDWHLREGPGHGECHLATCPSLPWGCHRCEQVTSDTAGPFLTAQVALGSWQLKCWEHSCPWLWHLRGSSTPDCELQSGRGASSLAASRDQSGNVCFRAAVRHFLCVLSALLAQLLHPRAASGVWGRARGDRQSLEETLGWRRC